MGFFDEIIAALRWSFSDVKRALFTMLIMAIPLVNVLFSGYLLRVIRAAWSTDRLPEWDYWSHYLGDGLRVLAISIIWIAFLVIPVWLITPFLPVTLGLVLTVPLFALWIWLYPATLLLLAETHLIQSCLWFNTLFAQCSTKEYVRALFQALLLGVALYALLLVLATITTFTIIGPIIIYLIGLYALYVSVAYLLAQGWTPAVRRTPLTRRR